MKLFRESVKHTNTNSTRNILQVKDYSEIFFNVFEVEINKNKYHVEKLCEYKGHPVVAVPVGVGEEEIIYPFVLVKGSPKILFNEKNIEFNEDYNESTQILSENSDKQIELVSIEELKEQVYADIQSQIDRATEEAYLEAEQLKKTKIQEANSEIVKKRKALSKMLESARSSLVDEFLKISEDTKAEIFQKNMESLVDLKTTIDNKLNLISEDTETLIKGDLKQFADDLDNKIGKVVSELYESIINSRLESEMKSISTDIIQKVDLIEHNLSLRLKDKASINDIKRIEEKSQIAIDGNINLNNTINKSVNKALSRIGQVNNKVDDLTIAITESLDSRIEEINTDYTNKIKILEDKTHDITDDVRNYLITVVNESRDNLISEIRKIKDEKPVQYILESKSGKSVPQDWQSFQKDIEKKIADRIDRERVDLRKYIAVYSGGGSVAQQFADGGTMNGNLTVVGTISASNYLGLPSSGVSGDYLPLTGGNVSGDLTVTGNVSSGGVQLAKVVDPVRTTVTGDGVLSSFAVSGIGSLTNPSALIVAIDGALQEPVIDYGISGGNIVFTSPIPNGSKAVIISPTNTVQVGQVVPSDGSVTSSKLANSIDFVNRPTSNGSGTPSPNSLITYEDEINYGGRWFDWNVGSGANNGVFFNGSTSDQIYNWTSGANPISPFNLAGDAATATLKFDNRTIVIKGLIFVSSTGGVIPSGTLARFVVGESHNQSVVGIPSKKGFGFVASNTGVSLWIHDGTSLTTSSEITPANYASNVWRSIELRLTNGVLSGNINGTPLNSPNALLSGSTTANNHVVSWQIDSGGSSSRWGMTQISSATIPS